MMEKEIDQYIFFDNGEIAITDYNFYFIETKIPLIKINEILFQRNQESNCIEMQIAKKNQEIICCGEIVDQTTFEIILLLNIALEPYREMDYISQMDDKVKNRYLELYNEEAVLALDNEADKEKKEKIAKQQLVRNRGEIEKYTRENRTKESVEFAANIRRRFRALLNLPTLNQEGIINKYAYEMLAEKKVLPMLLTRYEYKPDVFIFYANDYIAITDYEIYLMHYDESLPLHEMCFVLDLKDINEFYNKGDERTLVVSFHKQYRGKNELEIDTLLYSNHYKNRILYFLNIALKPHRDKNYVSKTQNAFFCFDFYTVINEYEKQGESFRKYIDEYVDNDVDIMKELEIERCEKERVEQRKRSIKNHVVEHGSEANQFSGFFAECFNELYEVDGIGYFDITHNRYDYEIYEEVNDGLKKYLEEMKEKGQRVLYANDRGQLIVTEKNIYIYSSVIPISSLKEVLECKTIGYWEAEDKWNEWLDDDTRYAIIYKSGESKCIKDTEIIVGADKIFYLVNLSLQMANSFDEPIDFQREKVLVCGKCGSVEIETADGFLGEKYRCKKCGNSSKGKMLVYTPYDRGRKDYYVEKLNQLKNRVHVINAVPIQPKPQLELFAKGHSSELTSDTINAIDDKNEAATDEMRLVCAEKISKIIHQYVLRYPDNDEKELLVTFLQNHIYSEQSTVQEKKRTLFFKIICNQCGKEILKDAKFCNFCGASTEEKTVCPKCGKVIEVSAKFCNFCGQMINREG